MGPPPEELIGKTMCEQEAVRTGAPISFIKMARLVGLERIEKMNPDNNKDTVEGGAANGKNGTLFQQKHKDILDSGDFSFISDFMLKAKDSGDLVYCRLGEKYLNDIEKRKNSNLTFAN